MNVGSYLLLFVIWVLGVEIDVLLEQSGNKRLITLRDGRSNHDKEDDDDDKWWPVSGDGIQSLQMRNVSIFQTSPLLSSAEIYMDTI